jgi:hypothetical protein
MKIKSTYLFLTIISLSLLLTTCKKYPENTLWWKSPKKIPVIQGNIVAYKVNGIDSLPFLNSYYVTYIVGSAPPRPPYTNTNKNIYDEHFTSGLTGVRGHITSNLGTGQYLWDRKKKQITIFYTPDILYFRKNIFISREDIDWEVLYLDKKGKSSIKTTYNGITYEITFED